MFSPYGNYCLDDSDFVKIATKPACIFRDIYVFHKKEDVVKYVKSKKGSSLSFKANGMK